MFEFVSEFDNLGQEQAAYTEEFASGSQRLIELVERLTVIARTLL